MRLRWERPRDGLARGFTDEGYQLAQVARIQNADGTYQAWAVLLLHPEGELFEQFRTPEEAIAAAEAAIGGVGEPRTGRDG